MFIFERCRCSSAAVTPVKYECDANNPTGTFARSKILLTEKLTNGALVPPTPVHIGPQVKTRQIQSYKFKEFAKTSNSFNFVKKKLCTQHTFWSCLISCANMKWIRCVLLKIQSGHDSVHWRTDGRTRWNQYTSLSYIIMKSEHKNKMLTGVRATIILMEADEDMHVMYTYIRK